MQGNGRASMTPAALTFSSPSHPYLQITSLEESNCPRNDDQVHAKRKELGIIVIIIIIIIIVVIINPQLVKIPGMRFAAICCDLLRFAAICSD
jgi:hypothetical protein